MKRTMFIVCLIALISAAIMAITPAAATTVTFTSDGDSMVSQLCDEDYGSAEYFLISSTFYEDESDNYRILFHFDFSSIPSGATINSAKLYLYKYNVPEGRTYNIHRMEAGWTENGVRWANQPGYDSTPTDSISLAAGWDEWDVAPDVQAFVAGTYPNYGWLIKDAVEDFPTSDPPGPTSYYASRECGDESLRPYLEVTYTGGEPAPTNEVYLEPASVSASFCEETTVQVYANTSDLFQGGQFNLTYDASCANVTDVEFNSIWDNPSATWWDTYTGYTRVSFGRTATSGMVSGTVWVCNLTIHGVCSANCSTALDYAPVTKLVNDYGAEVTADWTGGTFECTAAAEKPDLNVTEKYEEWVSLAEKTYNVTYTVKNIDAGEAGASNTTITIGGVDVLEDSVPGLAAGANYTNTVGPFTMSGNSDTITVCADNDNEVAESDEANNCMENEFVYPGMPDLNVTEKYETLDDGNFTVTYTVKNIGGAEAGASNTTIYVDGTAVMEDPTPALAAGANYTNTVGSFDCPCGTTVTVKVCADNDDVVDESDETNNCMENIVKCPGIPDLVVEKSVELVDGMFIVSYTVTNIGCGPAEESTTCKYVNGVEMETLPCPALGSGESHSGAFDPEPCPCGETLNVTVCADNYDVVDESDETNNCEVNIVKCPGIPDMVVEKSVELVDGMFIVSYTVTNIGCGPAEESTTCKYVNGVEMETLPCPALGSGESHSDAFDPEPCPCGETLNVTVCADNDNGVLESDETNNCEVNIVKCPPYWLPDLEITDIWTEVKVGKKANKTIIYYNITNNGGVEAGKSVSNLTVDGVEQKKKDNVKPLTAGETRTESFKYQGKTAPGTIMVCADCKDKIVESDETNNCLSNEFECPPCWLPDLEITDIWTEVKGKGKKIETIIYYNITNNGGVEAGKSVSNLTVDGVEQKKKDNVKPLTAGETRTESFKYQGKTAPGTIMVCADCKDKIVESDETNNCRTCP